MPTPCVQHLLSEVGTVENAEIRKNALWFLGEYAVTLVSGSAVLAVRLRLWPPWSAANFCADERLGRVGSGRGRAWFEGSVRHFDARILFWTGSGSENLSVQPFKGGG